MKATEKDGLARKVTCDHDCLLENLRSLDHTLENIFHFAVVENILQRVVERPQVLEQAVVVAGHLAGQPIFFGCLHGALLQTSVRPERQQSPVHKWRPGRGLYLVERKKEIGISPPRWLGGRRADCGCRRKKLGQKAQGRGGVTTEKWRRFCWRSMRSTRTRRRSPRWKAGASGTRLRRPGAMERVGSRKE